MTTGPFVRSENGQPSQQVAALHEKTRHLNNAIRQLNEERANIQRELNAIQSSTGDLPPEILSAIFGCAYPPIDFTTRSLRHWYNEDHPEDPPETLFALTLSAVSSYWRQVTLSTPTLWATLSLDIRDGSATTLANQASILRMYIDNCHPLPLSLELNRDPLSVSDDDLDEIRDIVLHHATRIRVLRLSEPPTTWPFTISEKWDRFTALEDLRLGWPSTNRQDDETWREVFLGKISSLRRVALKHAPPRVELPWNSITALNLYGIPVNTCVGLLIRCPNLVEYRSRVPTEEFLQFNSGGLWLDGETITVPHLEVMEWSFHLSPWCDALLARLHLPNIRTLALVGCHGYIPQPSFWHFVGRLPLGLRNLELARSNWRYDMLLQLFRHTTQLERLAVWDCGRDTFDDIFRALIPGEPEEDSGGAGTLPALGNLHISAGYDWFRERISQLQYLLEQVAERRSKKGHRVLWLSLDMLDTPATCGEIRGRKVEMVNGRTLLRVYDGILGSRFC